MEESNFQMKIFYLDKNCRRAWPIHEGAIWGILTQLIENRELGTTPGAAMANEDFEQLANCAWQSLMSMYNYTYHVSEDMNKLAYALNSINHVVFAEYNTVASEIVGRYLGIDPEVYSINRRAYIVANLKLFFSIDTKSDWQRSLGMICNDYAFEIRLAEHCLHMIEH